MAALEHGFQILPAGRLPRYIQQCQFRITENRQQDIVEIMGDTTGQGAHGLHLLGLEKLFFQLSNLAFGQNALRDVPPHTAHIRLAAIVFDTRTPRTSIWCFTAV